MRTTTWPGMPAGPLPEALGRGIALLLTLAVGSPAGAAAQASGDTLSVADAVAMARDANPGIQAMRLRADAATERIPQAGAWSNPILALGLRNRPVDGFGTDQPMTMNVIELRQQIPWPGKLGFSKERATHAAAAQELEADELEAQLLARVKSVYYRLAYMDRALDIMRETRELLRNFEDVSSAMYAVGRGLQQDVLQAQVAIAQMSEDITVMEQDRVARAARLNALLGRHATVPIGWLELPQAGGAILPVDSLMLVAAQARPALAAARRRVEAAEAGYRAARRTLYPDLMVTLGYGQRPQYTDFVTLMVGVSIPLFAGSSQLPLRREMEAMRSAEEARERDLYNETFARLTELRAQAERARNLSALYAASVLPQAQAAVESALSAYRVGRVDYMTLVANEMTVNRYEIETVRLVADYHQALAELEALVGTELGGGQ